MGRRHRKRRRRDTPADPQRRWYHFSTDKRPAHAARLGRDWELSLCGVLFRSSKQTLQDENCPKCDREFDKEFNRQTLTAPARKITRIQEVSFCPEAIPRRNAK